MSAVHVKEGTLSSLSCPLPDCGQPFTSSSLRALLSQDLFSRYTALSASRAVQAIEGLRFCPRCDPSALPDPRAVTLCPIKECDQEPSCPYAHSVGQVLEPVPCLPDGGLYVCSQCEFAFCGECMRSYHPGVSCEEASGGAGQEEALMQRIEELRKEENRSQVLLRQLQQQQAAILSERHIQQSAKSCPHCKMKIEKSGGCNHMTCASCRTHFCWLCLKVMPATSPYDHFATCKLSNGHIQAPDPTDQQARARIETTGRFAAQRQVAQAIPSIVCPNCRSRVFKDTHNNHLPCPSCSTPLCFQCRTAVRRPASHFSPRHPQHSDPRLDLERQHRGPGRLNLKPGSKPAPAAAAAPSPDEPIRGALRQAGPAAPAAGAEGGRGQ